MAGNAGDGSVCVMFNVASMGEIDVLIPLRVGKGGGEAGIYK